MNLRQEIAYRKITAWEESQHPRVPAGSSEGGRFGTGGATTRRPVGFLKQDPKTFLSKLPPEEQERLRAKEHIDLQNGSYGNRDLEQMTGMDAIHLKRQLLRGVKLPADTEMRLSAWPVSGEIQLRFTALDGTDISRRLFLGEKRAYHAGFELPPDKQSKGIAASFMKNSLDLYDHLGIRRATLAANVQVGGYAWARYGFIPASQDGWEGLKVGIRLRAEVGAVREPKLSAILRSDDPKSIREVAALPDGKKLLMGTEWDAVADLTDPGTYRVMRAYVNRKGKS